MTDNNTKAERSDYRAHPTQYMTAFCNHALVTNERMASPLDFTPELQFFALCLKWKDGSTWLRLLLLPS